MISSRNSLCYLSYPCPWQCPACPAPPRDLSLPPEPSPLAGATLCPFGQLSAPRTRLQSQDRWTKDKKHETIKKSGSKAAFPGRIWKDYNEVRNKYFHRKAQHKTNLCGCSSEVTWLWPWPWQEKELESSSWHSDTRLPRCERAAGNLVVEGLCCFLCGTWGWM